MGGPLCFTFFLLPIFFRSSPPSFCVMTWAHKLNSVANMLKIQYGEIPYLNHLVGREMSKPNKLHLGLYLIKPSRKYIYFKLYLKIKLGSSPLTTP